MKPLLYIHIGFPKTGTSTIQKFCNTNRDLLFENGIYYPAPRLGPVLRGHEGHVNMVEVASKLFEGRINWKEYRREYLNDLVRANCHINILSSESFAGENPENLAVFCDKFDVRLVCFIRNIFDYLISYEKQLVKEGLRPDLFSSLQYRNLHILGGVERHINFFGMDKCIFLNYDKAVKNGDLLKMFFQAIGVNYDFQKSEIKKANITPPDVAIRFLYQLSFLPFGRKEWNILRKDILQIDFSKWKSYRCTLLPSSFFMLDDLAKREVCRQGELLNDPGWYDYTVSRGRELASIPNHDLPVEVQHDIWNNISPKVRSIILRHWPDAGVASSDAPLLPSIEKIPSDVFEQMRILRHGYTVSFGAREKIQEQIALFEKRERERERAKLLSLTSRPLLPRLSDCLAPLFSSSARQAYVIRQSGLFDVGWYLERYADVAEAGIDPVLHYVRSGAHEGRDPAPWFSTTAYVQANSDVASGSMNPFYHYIRFGAGEGRMTYEVRF